MMLCERESSAKYLSNVDVQPRSSLEIFGIMLPRNLVLFSLDIVLSVLIAIVSSRSEIRRESMSENSR